jgi:hypothetical protein
MKLAICFLLGNFQAFEFYMPTFRNTLFHLHSRVGVEWLCSRNVGVFTGEKRFGSKMAWASRKEGDRVEVGPVTRPTSTLSPFFLLAQAIFEPSLLSLWIPLHFLNIVFLHLSAYEDGTECSETSAYTIQTPGNYPEESIQHSEHGESLKSRTMKLIMCAKSPPPLPFYTHTHTHTHTQHI